MKKKLIYICKTCGKVVTGIGFQYCGECKSCFCNLDMTKDNIPEGPPKPWYDRAAGKVLAGVAWLWRRIA